MALLPSIHARLQQACERHEEIALLMSSEDVISDQNRFRELSVEYAQLSPVVQTWEQWQAAQAAITEARLLLESSDAEMKELANEEITVATGEQERLEGELNLLLLPRDPDDENNIFLDCTVRI